MKDKFIQMHKINEIPVHAVFQMKANDFDKLLELSQQQTTPHRFESMKI